MTEIVNALVVATGVVEKVNVDPPFDEFNTGVPAVVDTVKSPASPRAGLTALEHDNVQLMTLRTRAGL